MDDGSLIEGTPPAMSTDASAGARSPNPTHVSVGVRSGEFVNPQNQSGAQVPNSYPYDADYTVWGK